MPQAEPKQRYIPRIINIAVLVFQTLAANTKTAIWASTTEKVCEKLGNFLEKFGGGLRASSV